MVLPKLGRDRCRALFLTKLGRVREWALLLFFEDSGVLGGGRGGDRDWALSLHFDESGLDWGGGSGGGGSDGCLDHLGLRSDGIFWPLSGEGPGEDSAVPLSSPGASWGVPVSC